jgi:S1-C subfamily serine protease
VAGVVSAAGGENVGFGIPPQLVRRVVPDLVEFGTYHHPFLGLSLREVTPATADANGLPEPRGVIVLETVENGPADDTLAPSTAQQVVDGRVVCSVGEDDVDVDVAGDLTSLATSRGAEDVEVGESVVEPLVGA